MCYCEHCKAATRMSRHLDIDCMTIQTLTAEVERLRNLIKAAPHGQWCRAKGIDPQYESGYCDCWKSINNEELP